MGLIEAKNGNLEGGCCSFAAEFFKKIKFQVFIYRVTRSGWYELTKEKTHDMVYYRVTWNGTHKNL